MAYEINYDDERFTQVEADKKQALTQVENMYQGMIDNSDKYYQSQIEASKQWADKQTELQNQQTDFAIDKIEQEKATAQKDYIKEQSGAYVDWQKQSSQYGAKAEHMAAGGFTGSGYSESSQVSMYNQWQTRVATAREAFTRIVADFTNAMTEARLKNSVALAEIAYKAQERQLALSLQGFQYKNQLLLEKANKITETENTYYQRYQDVLEQINHENALAEEVRQYNETLEEQKRQYNKTLELNREKAALEKGYQDALIKIQQEELAFQKSKYNAASGVSTAGAGEKVSSSKASANTKTTFEQNKNANITKKTGFTGTTYEEATAYLRKNGVSGYNLMTRTEWARRKASYKSTGIGGVEVSANSSYADYLATACEHAIANYK